MGKKVVIDSEVLESVLECIKKDIPMSIHGWEAEKIKNAMKKGSQKQFSIIEWHGPDEIPESDKAFFFWYGDCSFYEIWWPSNLWWPSWDKVRAWAYFP